MTTKSSLVFVRMNSILYLGIFHAKDNINNNVVYIKKEGLISLLIVGQQLFKPYSRKCKNEAVQLGFSSHSKGLILGLWPSYQAPNQNFNVHCRMLNAWLALCLSFAEFNKGHKAFRVLPFPTSSATVISWFTAWIRNPSTTQKGWRIAFPSPQPVLDLSRRLSCSRIR